MKRIIFDILIGLASGAVFFGFLFTLAVLSGAITR